MADIDLCALDLDGMESGRRFDWIKGAWLRLRAFTSQTYQDKLEELMAPHRALLSAAPDSEEAKRVTKDIANRAIAEAAVVEWNLTRGGQPLPCTPEVIYSTVSDPRFANLRTHIVACCRQDFLAVGEAADAGN